MDWKNLPHPLGRDGDSVQETGPHAYLTGLTPPSILYFFASGLPGKPQKEEAKGGNDAAVKRGQKCGSGPPINPVTTRFPPGNGSDHRLRTKKRTH
ncbi:MAG: hypothetical protein CM15mP125_4010 [Gammaproteobacteria bacterium]|nr:MAG: hypothetical protein CM15mP125_4010 [Gammaproteobacteria bacterium]